MAKIQYVEALDTDDFEQDFVPAQRVTSMTKRVKVREDHFDAGKPKSKKPPRRDKTAGADAWQPEPIEMPFIRRTNYR